MPVLPPQGLCARDAAPSRSVLTGPLLSAKLNPPTTPVSQVVRTGIRDTVCNAQSARLVLVAAPAGFGKTTLLAQWTARARARVAWLALDPGDSDPATFAPLHGRLAAGGGRAVRTGRRPGFAGGAAGAAPRRAARIPLLNDLAALDEEAWRSSSTTTT